MKGGGINVQPGLKKAGNNCLRMLAVGGLSPVLSTRKGSAEDGGNHEQEHGKWSREFNDW